MGSERKEVKVPTVIVQHLEDLQTVGAHLMCFFLLSKNSEKKLKQMFLCTLEIFFSLFQTILVSVHWRYFFYFSLETSKTYVNFFLCLSCDCAESKSDFDEHHKTSN